MVAISDGMGSGDVAARNSKKVAVASDSVHMDTTTGFLQVADAIYGAYLNNI